MERACLEPQRSMILEKLFYCASSAIVSAVATFSFSRFFQRRRQAHEQESMVESLPGQKEKTLDEGKQVELHVDKDILHEREKQVLHAVARSKDLEAQLAAAKEDKEAADDSCQDLEERLKEATSLVQQLKHELAKTKYAHKEMDDSYDALKADKEAALNKIQALKREIEDSQKSENEFKVNASGLQRSLSTQFSERKNAERQVKKLENELTEVRASRARLDSHYKASLQKLQAKLENAELERQKSQDELTHHLSLVSSTRHKVQAVGVEHLRMQQNYQQCQEKLREFALKHKAESLKHAETSSHLERAQERIRELEKELRITREAARNQMMRSYSSNSFESISTNHVSR